jgi:hypothetical protein
MEVSGQLHTQAALLPEKSPRCPLNAGLDGPQNQSGGYEEEKKIAPGGNRTPAGSLPVAIPTEVA